MATVYLSLGSNQGDRHAHIERAIALVASRYPEAALRRSDWYESEPWGYESANAYVNIAVALDFQTLPDPLELLHTLQGIERRVGRLPHRNADSSYRDRDIDIDIIYIDGVRLDTPQLTLPHPRAHLRDFVMVPLRQLWPDCDL